jgi:alpha-galactosidase
MPGQHSQFEANGKTFSGDYLMNIGLNVSSGQELTSAVFEIKER